MKMFAAVGVLIHQKHQHQKRNNRFHMERNLSNYQYIASLYQEQYLTQAQIAQRLNIDQSTVSRIINKLGLPKIKRSYCSLKGGRRNERNRKNKEKKKHWY